MIKNFYTHNWQKHEDDLTGSCLYICYDCDVKLIWYNKDAPYYYNPLLLKTCAETIMEQVLK